MRIAHFFISAFLLLIGFINATAQNQTHWYDLVQRQDVNFYNVKQAFDAEISLLKPAEANAQLKHFNRWKHQVLPFTDEVGNIMNATARQQAYKSIEANKRSTSGNWLELGPFTAKDIYRGVGRINCLAFHPTDSNIMWAGAPYGGVWKTIDYGNTWTCLTDNLPSFGVSAIAVDPNNTDILYVGTGDGETGRNPGFGVWKSTDGGITWQQKNSNMGNVIVNDILIYADDSEELIVATSVGIYKTLNGGDFWIEGQRNNMRELRFKPNDYNVVYAVSTGQFYRSEDRGRSWTFIRTPRAAAPRLCMAVSKAEPNSVWLVSEQVIFKSTEAGENLEVLYLEEGERDLGAQSWYNTACDVSPLNANTIYQGHVPTYVATDSITNWERLRGIHSDVHYMRHSPLTNRLWIAGDGGIVSLNDDGKSFTEHTNMGISEIYEMGQHPKLNDHLLNGYQDCGSKYFVGNTWKDRVGADGMDCVFDQNNPDNYFTTIQYGDIRRHIGGPDGKVSNFPDPQGNTQATRGPWVSPIWVDLNDNSTLYTAQHSIYRYQNCWENSPKKERWQKIDKGLPSSGEYTEIEQNEADNNIFYVLNGSFLYRTQNMHVDTPVWESLADNYQRTSQLLDVETSTRDKNEVYVSMNKRVIVSKDGGATFEERSDGLPELPIYSLQLDPISGHLYAGTDVGVYVLPNGQSVWRSFSQGLSLSAPVYEIEIFYDENNHDNSIIKAATFGRGMWESPLYGNQPDPNLPFYAFIKRDVDFLQQAEFTINVTFKRGWSHYNVKSFDANDLEITNAQVISSKGQQNQWTITLKALTEGEVSVKVPEGICESATVSGLFNQESEMLSFIYVQTGTQLGFEGPAGVGSLDQVAIWLDATDLLDNYSIGNEVIQWNDKLGRNAGANTVDTLPGPTLQLTDSSEFNSNAFVAFDAQNFTALRIDSLITKTNISAFTVAASNTLLFNEHAWLGSSRDANGFILHNYEEHKYARMMIYDSNKQVHRSPYLQVADPRQVHLYGMAYRNNVYIWNYTDAQEGFETVTTPKPRFESAPINVQLGRDRTDRYGTGKIAEHIIYNEALMQSHRTILYNYLSEKYGTDLEDLDYFHLNKPYNHNIAGIGKVSQIDYHNDAKGTGVLRVNNPTDLDVDEYLFWADNGEPFNDWTNYYLTLNNDLSFEVSKCNWKFEETGDLGKVTVSIDKDKLDIDNYKYYITNYVNVFQLFESDSWMSAQTSVDSGTVISLLRLPIGSSFRAPKVYPNIQHSGNCILNFQYQPLSSTQLNISIYNTKGQIVYNNTPSISEYNGIIKKIDLRNKQLQKGKYYIRITDGDEEWVEKFVIVD
ncbi:MAG: T9SS type A sorting domain-containing protein [Bacteroidia bacterium]